MLDIQIVIWVFNPGTRVTCKFDADSKWRSEATIPQIRQPTCAHCSWAGLGVPTIIEPLVKHVCQGYAGITRESCGQKMSEVESETKSINGTVESDYDQLLSNWNSNFQYQSESKRVVWSLLFHWLQEVLISGGDKRYLTRQGPGAKAIVWVWQLFDQVSPLNCLGMAMAKTVRPS